MNTRLALHSMRARIVLMNTLILAALFGAVGASLPPLVRAAMVRSIDRDLQERARRFEGPGPPGVPGDIHPGFGAGAAENARPMGPPAARSGPAEPPPDGWNDWPGAPRGPGVGDGNGPPPPPEPPTIGGVALRPRQIPVGTRGGGLTPPEPWDTRAYEEAATRRALFSTVTLGGEPVRVFSLPLPPQGPVRSVLQFPYPLGEVERAVSGLAGTLLALAPIVLLAAAGGGYLLTGRALRPVAAITRAAAQIGVEDLGRRIPQEGDDEFARLAATFNSMLARLDLAFTDRDRLIVELRDAVERQRRFTADASHELKTPLTAIKANTSLLISGTPALEEYRDATRDIDAAAAAMSKLVQDLLLLARSDAGQLSREKAVFPLAGPVGRSVAAARKTSAAPLTASVAPDLLVRGDEGALVRLFSNLLDNAARHTGATGSIAVRASAKEGWIRVEVIDTGCGIGPEHLPHLGERFYRADTHRTRSQGGTGLGLAICREIASAHGGSLDIASEIGKGTTVTVRLPIADG